mgnify:CR=1 FL=1
MQLHRRIAVVALMAGTLPAFAQTAFPEKDKQLRIVVPFGA